MMVIKKINKDDIELISALLASVWKVTYQGILSNSFLNNLKKDYWISTLNKLLTDNRVAGKKILINNEIVGVIIYGKSMIKKYHEQDEIIALYIANKFQNNGYGDILISEVINEYKSRKAKHLILWVAKQNSKARKFYARYGFETGIENKIKMGDKDIINMQIKIILN